MQTWQCTKRNHVAGMMHGFTIKTWGSADQFLNPMLPEALVHEVLVWHRRFQALERAKLCKPQVCLVEIGLPVIDGNELARRIRSHPENASAVLIAVTGYGQESDRLSTHAAGFDHHFVKPIDTKALASILSTMTAV